MACWVVPAIAAELWGVPVSHVLARIDEGSLQSKTEAGFLFVDVLPDAPALAAGTAHEPPPTYTVISDEEQEALETPAQEEVPVLAEVAEEVDPDEVENPFDEQTPSFSAKDWRQVRSSIARTRKPPRRPPLAA